MSNLANLPHVKMKNTATVAVRVPSEVIADWLAGDGARPIKTTIPAGAVVAILPEYAVRSRATWNADRDGNTEDAPPMTIDSPISMLCPQLEPADDEARAFIAEVVHQDLPNVKRALAELARQGAAERGEATVGKSVAKPRTY